MNPLCPPIHRDYPHAPRLWHAERLHKLITGQLLAQDVLSFGLTLQAFQELVGVSSLQKLRLPSDSLLGTSVTHQLFWDQVVIYVGKLVNGAEVEPRGDYFRVGSLMGMVYMEQPNTILDKEDYPFAVQPAIIHDWLLKIGQLVLGYACLHGMPHAQVCLCILTKHYGAKLILFARYPRGFDNGVKHAYLEELLLSDGVID